MKRIKKSLIAVIAIVMGIAGSAFNTVDPEGYFYEFIGDPTIESQVKSATQYKRVDFACTSDEGPLCGINLPTDKGLGNQPDSQELQAHEGDLWNSAQVEEAASSNIKMRN